MRSTVRATYSRWKAAVLSGVLLACGLAWAPAAAIEVDLELIADGLHQPVALASPPGDERRFIVEQTGRIRILMPDGELLKEPFLDLRDRLIPLRENFDERGLVGLAFHPEFARNGKFYVYYSAPLRADADMGRRLFRDNTSHISEFRVSADDPNRADPASERIVLQIDQPHINHSAGALAFGPDGYLYVASGEGGEASGNVANAPDRGQATDTLLGKILRIDVDGDPYRVPPDNPFVDRPGYLPEIFALGLRNPYRCTFDAGGDHALFCGDVGEFGYEEVDIVTSGGNYGWRIKEGRHCFDANNPLEHPKHCATNGLIDPIIEYTNCSLAADCAGRSIIGGYVYRGDAIPELRGRYVFGDWSAAPDKIGPSIFVASRHDESANSPWAFEPLEIANMDFAHWLLGFGQDADNELYVLTTDAVGPDPDKATGKIYKIVPAD